MLSSDGPLCDDLRVLGVDHYVLPYKWWMSKNSPLWKRMRRMLVNLAMIIPVAVMIKKWGCEVVYTNTITECIGAFVAFLLRRTTISSLWAIWRSFFKANAIARVGLPRRDFYLYEGDHEFTVRFTTNNIPIYLIPKSRIKDVEYSWRINFTCFGSGLLLRHGEEESMFRILYMTGKKFFFRHI